MAEYYVVLGDVVHSRGIEDREAFQKRLQSVCDRFTATERDDVFGNFKILKGVDEFGGVLQSLENLYEVVTAFQDELRPHGVRIVVSSGAIDVGLTSFDVERMDGEAFHDASERLEELEDGPLSFDLLAEDGSIGRAIADEVNLLLHLRSEWTERQREVVAVREAADTQTVAAEELGVSQQAVSNVLGGANWRLVSEVEERLRETLAVCAAERRSQWRSTNEDLERAVEAFAAADGDEALTRLEGALETTIRNRIGGALIESIQPRLGTTVEPVLASASDENRIETVLAQLANLSERSTSPKSRDLGLWVRVQYPRLVDQTIPAGDDPGAVATGDYATGLGQLLAEEPESAVQPLRNAWERRERDLPEHAHEYAWSAGVALLGCADVLGPSILDGSRGGLLDELAANRDLLRQPARHVLEVNESDGDADPEAVADAVHDDEYDQFATLEARAFATLLDLAEEQDALAG